MSSSKADEYRKRAEECRSKAGTSEDKNTEAFWVDLASRWQQSAEKVEALAKEAVDQDQAVAAEAA